jgi:transcriptional regulator with XRE-family HTH domain
MGYSRPQPRHLSSKLRKIRLKLNLTQQQMAKFVHHKRSPVYSGNISEFEKGKREPSPLVLLQYARAGRTKVETLIDDDLCLSYAADRECIGTLEGCHGSFR